MLKKLTILLVVLAMIIACTACGSDEQTDDTAAETDIESAEPMTGGWEIVDNEAAALPEEVQTAFDKATEQFTGSELTPVAYIANQIVAGTNYMILCESETTTAEPTRSYQMAVIYADLDGNAEITNLSTVDPADFNE